MKRTQLLLVAVLLLALVPPGRGQSVLNPRGLARVEALYQSWSLKGRDDLAQFAAPVYVYYPVTGALSLSLNTVPANARSDVAGSLSGLGDTQFRVNYYLEAARVVLNLGLNLPTGKTELSPEEFDVSTRIRPNALGMRLPNFGQGFNLALGFTWAAPVSDNVVVGLGAAYQRKGGFKPVQGLVENYRPGDEVSLTGGLDVRLAPAAYVSLDLLFTLYGTDRIGENEVFAAGNKLLFSVQYRQAFAFHELWALARYRSRAKNQLALFFGEPLQTESQQSVPNQFELLAHYRHRFAPRFHLKALVEARLYPQAPAFRSFDTTPFSAGVTLFGFGLEPQFRVARNVTLPVRFQYFTGSFKQGPAVSGLEVGGGVRVGF